jgi:hypothetical protein
LRPKYSRVFKESKSSIEHCAPHLVHVVIE